MRSVEIRMPGRELRERMATMRIWLDEHRFEPSGFSCRDGEESVLVRLEFRVASEAEAFAVRFGGRPLGPGGAAAGEAESDILKSVLSGGVVG